MRRLLFGPTLGVLLVFGVLATYPAAADASAPHYYLNSFNYEVPQGVQVPTMSWGTLTLTPAAPSLEGPVSCENSPAGFVENPVGGEAGDGQTSVFLSWNCERPVGCPTAEVEFPPGSGKKVMQEAVVYPGGYLDRVHENVLGESLPWPGELTEAVAGKIRAAMKGVVFIGLCQVRKSVEGSGALGDGDGDSPQLVKKSTVCFTTKPLGEAQETSNWEPLTENGTQIGGPFTSKLHWDTPGSGHLLCEGEKGGGSREIITYAGNVAGDIKYFTYEGQELILTH